MTAKKFKIISLGVHTIDYATSGKPPTLEEGGNLSITGPMITHPGGIGNGIPVAAKLFPGEVGAATLLGDDANGREFYEQMQSAGVDTGGIRWAHELPDQDYEIAGPTGDVITVRRERLSTGMSFVNLHPITKDPLIFFSPGINQVISQDTLDFRYLTQAEAVIISYATLLRALDRDRGEPMAKLIRDLRQENVLTVLDTHSIRGADYGVLEKPLREVDIFGCNIGEARSITGLDGSASQEQLINGLADRMNIEGTRSRIIAVTMKDKGCAVAYFRQGEKAPAIIAQVPACNITPVDATGAGDTFKAGLVAYVVKHLEEFRRGTLDIREAAQFGNATAASYIKDIGTRGVGNFEETMAFMRQQYPQTLSPATLGQPGTPTARITERPL